MLAASRATITIVDPMKSLEDSRSCCEVLAREKLRLRTPTTLRPMPWHKKQRSSETIGLTMPSTSSPPTR